MTGRLAFASAIAGALALIIGSALLSHSWNSDGSLDPLYLILALAVVVLAFPPTRSWLEDATNVKLPGGFEITRQLEDAVAAAAVLPDVDEESERRPGHLKILHEDWRGNPASSLGRLQGKLSERLHWIARELYDGSQLGDVEAIDRLKKEGLIRPDQARLLDAVCELTGKAVERHFDKGGDAKQSMVRLLEEADRTIYSSRLIVLDKYLRKSLEQSGLATIDVGAQPESRWPDFYVFDPDKPSNPPLKVVVRVALKKNSDLIDKIRRRLQTKTNENPLDARARRVIVFPRISKSQASEDLNIPAMPRHAFEQRAAEMVNETA